MNPPPAFGTFRVLHQIGSGVLGPVFRSYDAQRERLVVVKAFRVDLVPEQTAVLADALRAIVARPVDDAGVVRAVDAGLEGATPFLALEFVSDDTLDAVLRESRPITTDNVLSLCRAIGSAIDSAWEIGIGHGALHPRDVFVRGTGEVAITGFGVAQALQSVGVRAAARRPYGAPERVEGTTWDRRADVYSLGAMTQELLARVGAPSPEIGAVLDKALSDNPDERFVTAAAFVEALSAAIEATPQVIESPAAVTTNAHRSMEIDAPAAAADPVADTPIRAGSYQDSLRPGAHIGPASTILGEIDEPPLPVSAAVMVQRNPRQPFPWGAMAAVALACLVVGALTGFRFGLARNSDERIEREIARASAPPIATTEPKAPVVVPPDAVAAPVVSAPAPPRRSVQAVATDANGSLEVDSRPRGARVIVDGKAIGQTPLRVPEMSPGDHRVLIELLGHRRVSSLVKVVAGEQKRFAVSLELLDVPTTRRERGR